MPLFTHIMRMLLLLLICHNNPAIAQPFNFTRVINPFPIVDQNMQPYEFAMSGGLNSPVMQLVDIDGNQTLDLFLQDRSNQLIFYTNSGTPDQYDFRWVSDNFANLQIGDWFKFVDADNDGDVDLYTESNFGIIRYYRNDGSPTLANFVLAADTLRDINGTLIFADNVSIPDWADIDCDNDADLFLGRQSGYISYYQFIGLDNNNVPIFEHITEQFGGIQILTGGAAGQGQPESDDGERHGANSLTFVDIDNDGDLDIFWGDFFAVSLIFIENVGTCFAPDMVIAAEEYPPGNPVSTGGYNVPRFADIDADGDFDMFLGVRGGWVSTNINSAANTFYYENVGSAGAPNFQLITESFISAIDIGVNSIPALADIDGDGDLDLFVANQQDVNSPETNSRVYFFRNDGSNAFPSYRLESRDYLANDIRFSLNYAIAFSDIDADGDLDMFLGKWDGRISYLRNDGSATQPNFVPVETIYQNIDVGNFSTPWFADIDNDGDQDLFIGEFIGNINYYRNDGTATAAQFTLITPDYFSIDVGEYSNPSFLDIDGDGDYDLLTGSGSSGAALFLNDGTPENARFTPRDTTSFPVTLRSTPRLIDTNYDGQFDFLISGSGGGGLYYYANGPLIDIEPEPFPGNLPLGINLAQNYPNPFNPTTVIRYSLSVNRFATLKVYDLTGRELRTLVNEPKQAGEYSVSWDGRDDASNRLGSGIYFYRLSAGEFQQSRKMILIR